MPTITKTLVMEHRVFCAVFDQMERVLPKLGTAQEVKVLATIVEGMLGGHAETETNLAYAALDHALEEHGELRRLHQDHKEIDLHFGRVHQAGDLAKARNLFKQALAASREHFQQEERSVFPLIERVLPAEMLGELGDTWLRHGAAATA